MNPADIIDFDVRKKQIEPNELKPCDKCDDLATIEAVVDITFRAERYYCLCEECYQTFKENNYEINGTNKNIL